ncbi:MAG: DUF4363 family protein [Clostridia bacterium]|nr:DUF4363 family protein [Clostridia bacterium]
MKKEIIIIVIILFFIVSIDFVLSRNIHNSIGDICLELGELNDLIEKKNFDEINIKFDGVEESWLDSEKSFSFYLEHDELEKVGTELAVLKSNIGSEQWDEAEVDISKLQFILEHLKEKIDLKLKNIF